VSASFDFQDPSHFTAGAVGPPGERVFYLQAREGASLVSLKCEKEQVRALASYLAGVLDRLADTGGPPGDPTLVEPVNPAWAVASIGVGHDEARGRLVVVASELLEEEEGAEAAQAAEPAEPASARFAITRAQAAAFVERAEILMRAGRAICPVCSQPKDPAGHVCPRSNGHAVH
jgi:uncharacterized repeat protein (TIGR03847 family)